MGHAGTDIQIHSRLPELRTLLESLRAVQGIEEALLVLSHDFFADDILAEVERVDFCQVKLTANDGPVLLC